MSWCYLSISYRYPMHASHVHHVSHFSCVYDRIKGFVNGRSRELNCCAVLYYTNAKLAGKPCVSAQQSGYLRSKRRDLLWSVCVMCYWIEQDIVLGSNSSDEKGCPPEEWDEWRSPLCLSSPGLCINSVPPAIIKLLIHLNYNFEFVVYGVWYKWKY